MEVIPMSIETSKFWPVNKGLREKINCWRDLYRHCLRKMDDLTAKQRKRIPPRLKDVVSLFCSFYNIHNMEIEPYKSFCFSVYITD